MQCSLQEQHNSDLIWSDLISAKTFPCRVLSLLPTFFLSFCLSVFLSSSLSFSLSLLHVLSITNDGHVILNRYTTIWSKTKNIDSRETHQSLIHSSSRNVWICSKHSQVQLWMNEIMPRDKFGQVREIGKLSTVQYHISAQTERVFQNRTIWAIDSADMLQSFPWARLHWYILRLHIHCTVQCTYSTLQYMAPSSTTPRSPWGNHWLFHDGRLKIKLNYHYASLRSSQKSIHGCFRSTLLFTEPLPLSTRLTICLRRGDLSRKRNVKCRGFLSPLPKPQTPDHSPWAPARAWPTLHQGKLFLFSPLDAVNSYLDLQPFHFVSLIFLPFLFFALCGFLAP